MEKDFIKLDLVELLGKWKVDNWSIEKAFKEPLTPSYPRRKWD